MTDVSAIKDIQTALLNCLQDIPFLKITEIQAEAQIDAGRPDAIVRLQLSSGEQTLIVEVKRNGQPRQAREAISQLQQYCRSFRDAYGVVAAPYISPATAAICKKEGVGYIDLSGNCLISFKQVYIRREGNPNRFEERRSLRSLYSPRATRVLRVLLANPNRSWKLQHLAQEAQVSLGQVHKVKSLLLDREWLRSTIMGLSLNKPDQLLAEWAENYEYRRNKVLDYYSLKGTSDVEYDLADACRALHMRCALTAFSAAARYAPQVRYPRAMAYVEGELEELATRIGLKRVTSGANVSLLVPYDEGVFYGTRDYDAVPVVSPIQTYLDLKGPAGRGEEAANFLLEEVIRSGWRREQTTTPKQ